MRDTQHLADHKALPAVAVDDDDETAIRVVLARGRPPKGCIWSHERGLVWYRRCICSSLIGQIVRVRESSKLQDALVVEGDSRKMVTDHSPFWDFLFVMLHEKPRRSLLLVLRNFVSSSRSLTSGILHVLIFLLHSILSSVDYEPCNLPHASLSRVCFITAEKGGVARAKGEGEKEKEWTTEGTSRRRRDEKAPWALNYGSWEGGGVERGRRRGGEKRAMHVWCVCGPWRQGCCRCWCWCAAFAKMRPTFPLMPE